MKSVGNWIKTGLVAASFATMNTIALTQPVMAADTYTLDETHTEVRFHFNHLGFSTLSGTFRSVTGTVVWDVEAPENSSVEVVIDPASISTDVASRTEALVSDEFFDVVQFPEITFKSTNVTKTGYDRGIIEGELTMHGVTLPVALDAQLNWAGDHPLAPYVPKYEGAYYAGFTATTKIVRSEFGVGAYAPGTSDIIEVVINTEMRRQ